jgi:protein gp37
MAENSKIEWTDHTFNPWVGCTKVSPACDHCYAESWAKRSGSPQLWDDGQRRRTKPSNWNQPLKWNAQAASAGRRARVFCASLADVFDNTVPDEWRADLFSLIKKTPHLDWLLLSKRIGNARSMLPLDWGDGYENVWIGSTVVTQEEVNRDLLKLLKVPAKVRFLSCEPLLEPICIGLVGTLPKSDFSGYQLVCDRLHWVIVGGESGAKARPMAQQWVEQIRDECFDADVAFFMKQGSQANWPAFKDFERFGDSVRVREWPRATFS